MPPEFAIHGPRDDVDKRRQNDRTPDRTGASLVLPFALRGATGRVDVEVLPNTDPVRMGQPLVAIGFDEERFRGFPVVRASITYSGEGIRAAMGWIQVIRHIGADRVAEVAVDRFPLGPDDSPLYAYGYLPTFFDAPANPDHPDGVWQADTWLIAIPDVIRSRRVSPVTGFRWGYRLESGRPSLRPLTRLALPDWRDLLPALRDEHRRWEFLESPLE